MSQILIVQSGLRPGELFLLPKNKEQDSSAMVIVPPATASCHFAIAQTDNGQWALVREQIHGATEPLDVLMMFHDKEVAVGALRELTAALMETDDGAPGEAIAASQQPAKSGSAKTLKGLAIGSILGAGVLYLVFLAFSPTKPNQDVSRPAKTPAAEKTVKNTPDTNEAPEASGSIIFSSGNRDVTLDELINSELPLRTPPPPPPIPAEKPTNRSPGDNFADMINSGKNKRSGNP